MLAKPRRDLVVQVTDAVAYTLEASQITIPVVLFFLFSFFLS